MFPRPFAIDVLEFVLEALGGSELAELLAVDLELGDGGDLVGGVAGVAGRNEAPFAVGEGDDGGAELDGFERGVLGDVARTGDGDAFAFEGLLPRAGVFDHVFDVLVWVLAVIWRNLWVTGRGYVDKAIASGFRSDQATSPRFALAC